MEEPMKIAKEFRWEMGHRLPNHDGACRNVHGHSYRMQVEVEGHVDPETGMVMDFGDISAIVKPLVAELDHAFLCQDSDTEVLELLERMDMKRVIIHVPSTVENICKLFIDRLRPVFARVPQVRTFTVRIWETASSEAELTESV
jgi:6-pyruvoyltetrahydropterin/6-carboxytetrahydropterin synthase